MSRIRASHHEIRGHEGVRKKLPDRALQGLETKPVDWGNGGGLAIVFPLPDPDAVVRNHLFNVIQNFPDAFVPAILKLSTWVRVLRNSSSVAGFAIDAPVVIVPCEAVSRNISYEYDVHDIIKNLLF